MSKPEQSAGRGAAAAGADCPSGEGCEPVTTFQPQAANESPKDTAETLSRKRPSGWPNPRLLKDVSANHQAANLYTGLGMASVSAELKAGGRVLEWLYKADLSCREIFVGSGNSGIPLPNSSCLLTGQPTLSLWASGYARELSTLFLCIFLLCFPLYFKNGKINTTE